jgi:DNA mismatch repair protein MutS2
LKGDIAGIAEIEGMTEKSAISLVIEAIAANEGVSIKDFLKTREAYEIYKKIILLISDCASTDYAKSKLQLFFPYPAREIDRIHKVRKKVTSIGKMTLDIDTTEISSYLIKVRPVKKNISIPVIGDRVIIATTSEEFEAAKSFPVQVQLITEAREVVDIARGYSHVIISTEFAGIDLPYDINLDFMDITRAETWQVAQEKEIIFFAKNYESISNAIRVFNNIRQYIPDFFSKISPEQIERLSQELTKISRDGGLKSGIDSDIDRYQSIFDRMNEVIALIEKNSNSDFSALIEQSSVTVRGFDLLTAINGTANVIFEKEIREKYNTVTANAVHSVAAELGLDPAESQYLDNFFNDEVMYPIRVNQRAVDEMKNHLLRSITSRKLVLLRASARELSKLKEPASHLVREVLDFDVSYTIVRFAEKYNLNMPVIQDCSGIGINEGINLFLKAPVPINYSVGRSRFNEGIGKLRDSRVVLLSGVNSGGKTSTLDLLAQVVILAQMGFPVPAKQSEIGLVDEFYYFGKSRGTMDAGAFESTIKALSSVANKKSKLVLADEMESITEPGASAKIISGILEEINDNKGLGVFVSHLSEAILKNTDNEIRVDGIEARGLDEELNLIVDRNPRYNYLARSTPELIVERLARKEKENEFYDRLLRKFKIK